MDTIKIGDAEIRRVEEMKISTPMAFVTQNTALIEENRHWLSPWFLDANDHWDIHFQSWVLFTGGKVVVIDPCTGNGRPHMMHYFNMLDTPYIERFSATGVKPEDVDYVFCTHMHHDHCGWNTQLRDGRYVPTFPNARYLFTRREYERWDSCRPGFRYVDYNEGVYERSIQPVVEAGLADLVNDYHPIIDELTIEPAYGHTFAHSMLHLVSRAEEAYFSGDVFHHPIQLADPTIQFGDCDDLEQAIATRRRLIELSIERDALIIPAHLPAPHAMRAQLVDGKIVFEALAKPMSSAI